MAFLQAYADPAILYNQVTYTLANPANIEYNFNEHDFIMHTSVITGKHTIYSKGTYYRASMDLLNLTYSLYDNLIALRGKTVTFYPYGTANIVIGQSTYDAISMSMIVTAVKFFHVDNALWTDACYIEMESESYYELDLNLQGI